MIYWYALFLIDADEMNKEAPEDYDAITDILNCEKFSINYEIIFLNKYKVGEQISLSACLETVMLSLYFDTDSTNETYDDATTVREGDFYSSLFVLI